MRGEAMNEDFDKVAERASYWMERAEKAEAEVARLEWMLGECIRGVADALEKTQHGVDRETWKSDLAARYEAEQK